MTLKAIDITEDNKSKLSQEYHDEDDVFDDAVGYTLVVSFGFGKRYDGLFSATDLPKYFRKTGKILENDYYEVEYERQ